MRPRLETLGNLTSWKDSGLTRICTWSENIVPTSKERVIQCYAVLTACFPTGDLTSYTGIFDYYRIKEYTVTFEPTILTPFTVGSATVLPPQVLSWVDFDGFNEDAISYAQIMELATLHVHKPGSVVKRRIQPMYKLTTGGKDSSLSREWLDLSNTSVHFNAVGLHFRPSVAGTGEPPVGLVSGTLYHSCIVQFRGSR